MSHIEVTKAGLKFKIHKALSENLDLIKENQKKDWDFKLAISGDGMTRTGKSTVAALICAYQDKEFVKNWKDRIIFDGGKLIEQAYKVPKGSWLMYDEAREGLDSRKQMERYTKNLLDFFSQCGNLNLGIVIVLPEFFELPKSIAINQTVCLINCFARNGFDRGYFDFFNRKDKRYLFVNGQKYLNYQAQKPSFRGTFNNWFPVNKAEYERLKNKTLNKIRKKENVSEIKQREETHRIRIKILLKHLIKEVKLKPAFLGELLGISRSRIYDYIRDKKPK